MDDWVEFFYVIMEIGTPNMYTFQSNASILSTWNGAAGRPAPQLRMW